MSHTHNISSALCYLLFNNRLVLDDSQQTDLRSVSSQNGQFAEIFPQKVMEYWENENEK